MSNSSSPSLIAQYGSDSCPYELGEPLGEGTFARVYNGTHQPSGQKVAIKLVAPSQFNYREIEIWSGLDHANIVRLLDVVQGRTSEQNAESMIYVVSELADGGELFSLLQQHPQGLPTEDAAHLFSQIAQAVDACHRQFQVVHRDIKVENILLFRSQDSGFVAKLADFGFSCKIENSGLLTDHCGSPEYAAPELLYSKPYDGQQADCWALGVVLYTMLSGGLPFAATTPTTSRHLIFDLKKSIASENLVFSDKVPKTLRRITTGLLTRDPSRRLTAFKALEMIEGDVELSTHNTLQRLNASTSTISSNEVPRVLNGHQDNLFSFSGMWQAIRDRVVHSPDQYKEIKQSDSPYTSPEL